MKVFAYSLTVALTLLTGSLAAQERLGNDQVIQMVKDGIPESVIVAKIQNSETKFDVSTEALKMLVSNKVPDEVIKSMIARKETHVEITLDSPENGKLSELAGLKKVYFYTDDARSREILVRELKDDSRFESVDTIEKADFVIVFKIVGFEYNTVFFGTMNNKAITGDLYVVKLGGKDDHGRTRVRILYSARKTKNVPADAHPAKSTIKKFIKDYESASKVA
jgi:hypothetical protein